MVGLNKEFSRERRVFLTRDYSRGFIGDVGYEVHDYRKGYLGSRLKVLNRHRQQDQSIHAGVLAAKAPVTLMSVHQNKIKKVTMDRECFG